MIIQIRGTSGSGKSTAMKWILDSMFWQAEYAEGRKRPLYYRGVDEAEGIVILGHYESPCGGCDTIGSARAVYDLIQTLSTSVILCEGLLLSEDVKWTSQMTNVRCIFLTTPLDVCLKQIEARRKADGNDKPLNPANTSNRVKTIQRARDKLEGMGVYCRGASASQAPKLIMSWLRGAI